MAFRSSVIRLFASSSPEQTQADVTSELIAHVVEYLEARDRGVQKGYRPFELVANGN